jgi:hypothetical protein
MLQAMAPATTIVLLGAMQAQNGAWRDDPGIDRYHLEARRAVNSVPIRFDGWVGNDVEVPQAAVALLRPNALLGRRYVHEASGRVAQLLIVQCRDTRDMSGHYPPVCYPAHGWTRGADPLRVELGGPGGPLEVTRYAFERAEFDRVARITIFGFFVVPGVGIVQDMEGVREAASDYRLRRRGAAQIQVLVDASLPTLEQERIAGEILGAIGPAIDGLLGEGSAGETQ